jgi:hypothetical protein
MVDTTRQESILRELPEIEQFKTGLIGSSKALVDAANQRAQSGQYLTPDYEIAGMSPDQLAAMQMGRQGIGAYQPFLTAGTQGTTAGSATLGEAANVLRGADTRQQFGAAQSALNQGVGALQGAAQMYDPNSVQQFMNPYQQQVIDEATRQINRQGDISRQELQAQATRAGAFGGSREGVQRAELERGLAEQKNAAIVGALSQGYNQASNQSLQAFEAQQGRQLQQAQGLQNIGQGIGSLAGQQFGVGSQIAQGLGSLGTQQSNIGMQQAALGQQSQAMGQQDTNFLYNLGSSQQRQVQAELDASRQNELQRNMQPYQQMGFLSDIYKGAPTSQMGITSSTAPTQSPFMQAAGLGIAGVSAAAAGQRAGIL